MVYPWRFGGIEALRSGCHVDETAGKKRDDICVLRGVLSYLILSCVRISVIFFLFQAAHLG